MAITNVDRRMVAYFIQTQGDVTRWVYWNSRKKEIAETYPELIKALQDYEVAKKILNLVVEQIERDDDGT